MHHILAGTSFDSLDDHWPSQCHEDTRTDIRDRIHRWIHDEDRDKKLCWLSGPAGVGKTTIMRAIAEAESDNCLVATIFFSKSKPNYLERIFPTISYHLSLKDPSYRAYMGEIRRTDPFYYQKSLKNQFEKLFVIPCSQRRLLDDTQAWVIMLDDLDKSRGVAGENDSGYVLAQRTIVSLISAFVQEHPAVPLVWIISSRSEHHLTAAFSHPNVSAGFFREDISIDSAEACQDVERYLRSALSSTVLQYPFHFVESEPWPSTDDVLLITCAACGFFIFAVVVVRFIQDPSIGNPIDRLADVRSTIQKTTPLDRRSTGPNPFATLDMMYTEILQRISSETYEDTRRLLAYCFFKQPNYSLVQICNLMGIERHIAYVALQNLHSVLNIPPPDLAYQYNVRAFHRSFADFLLDTKRSQNFGIGPAHLTKVTEEYWHAYFRILQQAVRHGEQALIISFVHQCSTDYRKGASSISLVWQSGSPEKDKGLRLSLLEEAQNCWASTLTTMRPIGSSVGLAGPCNLFVCAPISNLLETLKQMDFSRLDRYMPQTGSSVPTDFLDSLGNLCRVRRRFMVSAGLYSHRMKLFPKEVERSGLVEHVTFDSLDLNHVDPDIQRVRYLLGPTTVLKVRRIRGTDL